MTIRMVFKITRNSVFFAVLFWCFIVPAQGSIYKCVNENGEVAYQSRPCDTDSAESKIKEQKAPASNTKQKVYANPVPESTYDSAKRNNVDTGPLETWDRFTKAWNKGDKQGVMKELTPGMQKKFEPTYDKLQK